MCDEISTAEPNLAPDTKDGLMKSPPVETDGFGSSLLSPNRLPKNDLYLTTVNKYDDYYKMDHKKRGYAVIFNHEHFDIPNLSQRSGTNVDCEELKGALVHLGFNVSVYKDLTKIKVLDTIEKYAKMDHSDCDCFVMCVLSHGEDGYLYTRDTVYSHNEIWNLFSARKCPTLAGKPKLFFFQACRGSKLDPGVKMNVTQVDSSGPSYRLPSFADFLMAYSTAEGYYSWRNTGKGSWFIQALVTELKENGFNYDLMTLLTFVNRRVAIDFESNVPNDMKMHHQKQMPAATHMLTRLVKFRPPQ